MQCNVSYRAAPAGLVNFLLLSFPFVRFVVVKAEHYLLFSAPPRPASLTRAKLAEGEEKAK
jgi:hypothetical protein